MAVDDRFTLSLVVGKFSPLHKGHELLIENALSRSSRVVILTYSKPEFEGCSVERRERWLKARFPNAVIAAVDDPRIGKRLPGRKVPENEASATEHRDFCAMICKEWIGELPQAVFTSEEYGDGFAAHLSRVFGSPVRHVCVDQSRARVPISATRIREAIHEQRHHLAPGVYPDFIETVCFLGAESTGKSTLVRRCADRFGSVAVDEYGRTLWEEKDGRLEPQDMIRIARTHVAMEDEARTRAVRFLFVDTSPLTTLFYEEAMFGARTPELVELSWRKYDRIFLCEPDFPLVQDGTRQDETFRRRQHEWYLNALKERNWSYSTLRGSEQARFAEIEARLLQTTTQSSSSSSSSS